jgi:hypothetical protein
MAEMTSQHEGRCKYTEYVKVKGKAFLLQAWTGPWGSRRLRLQYF